MSIILMDADYRSNERMVSYAWWCYYGLLESFCSFSTALSPAQTISLSFLYLTFLPPLLSFLTLFSHYFLSPSSSEKVSPFLKDVLDSQLHRHHGDRYRGDNEREWWRDGLMKWWQQRGNSDFLWPSLVRWNSKEQIVHRVDGLTGRGRVRRVKWNDGGWRSRGK